MFKKVLFLCVLCLCLFSREVRAVNLPGNTVILGALDKVTGRVSSLTVDVGNIVYFGSLRIKVFACYYKPPEEAPDNVVFLNISEEKKAEGKNKDEVVQYFNGWMFSSSPAVSALEHSMYDIWSIECKNAEQEAVPEALKD